MKEFVSKVFFINLLKIKSNSGSKYLFARFERSLKVITAFLLNEDLKFSTNFMRSGVISLIVA